jgi:hypothetical protein
VFHAVGIFPIFRLWLNRSQRDVQIWGAQNHSSLAGMLLGPVALLSSRERRIFFTSSGVITMSLNILFKVVVVLVDG